MGDEVDVDAGRATSSVASMSAAAASLTSSPVPSEPVPLICSVISAAFLCADRP